MAGTVGFRRDRELLTFINSYLQKSSKSSTKNSIVFKAEFEVVSSNSEARGPSCALMRNSRLQGIKDEALLAAEASRFRRELKKDSLWVLVLFPVLEKVAWEQIQYSKLYNNRR